MGEMSTRPVVLSTNLNKPAAFVVDSSALAEPGEDLWEETDHGTMQVGNNGANETRFA